MNTDVDFEAAKKALWGSERATAEHILRIITIPPSSVLTDKEREAVNFLMNHHGYTVDFDVRRVAE
jgi:hypothetical protein